MERSEGTLRGPLRPKMTNIQYTDTAERNWTTIGFTGSVQVTLRFQILSFVQILPGLLINNYQLTIIPGLLAKIWCSVRGFLHLFRLLKQTSSLCELSCALNYITKNIPNVLCMLMIAQEVNHCCSRYSTISKFLQGSRHCDVTRPAYKSVQFIDTSENG